MNETVRKVDTRHGFSLSVFENSSFARQIAEHGEWEPDETRTVLDLLRPGDSFVDVGAHVGYYSRLALTRGANVVALEPNPETFNLLLMNVTWNGQSAPRIQAFMRAASNVSGKSEYFPSPDDMLGSLGGGETGRGKLVVETERLDHIMWILERESERAGVVPTREYRLLKSDTEGAEMLVLDGLGDRARDVEYVLVEVQNVRLERFGAKEDDVRAKLRSAGFEIERAFSTQNELWRRSS